LAFWFWFATSLRVMLDKGEVARGCGGVLICISIALLSGNSSIAEKQGIVLLHLMCPFVRGERNSISVTVYGQTFHYKGCSEI
jgi:hypothetical protein